MLTYTPNNHKGRVMLPKFMKKNVTQNPLAVPYLYLQLIYLYLQLIKCIKSRSVVYLIYQRLARKAVEDELHDNEDQVQVQGGDCSRWRQPTRLRWVGD